MELIDDEGNLFGLVNVIDALAVLLVLAIVVAGLALVFSSDAGEPATRYATVDLGEQPRYVAEQISAGDQQLADAPGNLTVTDVFVTPTDSDRVRVFARVRLAGTLTGDEPQRFSFAGNQLRPGDEITIETSQYDAEGRVESTSTGGEELLTGETDVTLATTVPTDVSRLVEAGDRVVTADRTVATVTNVTVAPAADADTHRVYLGATVETFQERTRPLFGNGSVVVGTTIPFETGGYTITPSVVGVGTDALSLSRTAVVVETTVSSTTAGAIEAGDAYTIKGEPVATVETVEQYPTADRDREHVLLGLSLETVADGTTPQFGQRAVTLGTTVPFRTSSYNLSGEIVRVGGHAPLGEVTDTPVTIVVEDVRPTVADGIRVGMTETRDGTTYAEITNKRTENATVILESEDGNIYSRDHPVNLDVTLDATLRTRRTETGLVFHAERLQEGDEIALDLGSITVRGTVVDVGA